MNHVAVIAGAVLIGLPFGAGITVMVRDLGWKAAVAGPVVALAVTGMMGAGAVLIAFGVTAR